MMNYYGCKPLSQLMAQTMWKFSVAFLLISKPLIFSSLHHASPETMLTGSGTHSRPSGQPKPPPGPAPRSSPRPSGPTVPAQPQLPRGSSRPMAGRPWRSGTYARSGFWQHALPIPSSAWLVPRPRLPSWRPRCSRPLAEPAFPSRWPPGTSWTSGPSSGRQARLPAS